MRILRGKVLNGLVLSFASVLSVASGAIAGDFPRSPDPKLTPGTLCQSPDSYRYPEEIPYCNRAVSSKRKREIFEAYKRKLGYPTAKIARSKFKIDHYIPLCMGGGNDDENLWPQHVSIYTLTDRVDELLCDKLAAGRLTQAEAIAQIKEVKAHPETGPAVAARLEQEALNSLVQNCESLSNDPYNAGKLQSAGLQAGRI